MGLALRAAGHGLNVCVIRFLKERSRPGEVLALEKFPNVKVFSFGYSDLTPEKAALRREDNRAKVRRGLEFARRAIGGGEFDVVILDELNFALHYDMADVGEVVEMLKSKPQNVEVVITGRNAPQELIEVADLVTEFREIKHPYHSKGIGRRAGIEY